METLPLVLAGVDPLSILLEVVLTAAFSAGLSVVENAILGGPKQASQPGLLDALATKVTPDGPLPAVMGRRRVGGTLRFNAKAKDTTYLVIVLAGAPISGVNAVYIDNKRVTIDADGNVTSAPWKKDGRNSINIKIYDGNQTVSDNKLDQAFIDWTQSTIGLKTAFARIAITPIPRGKFQKAFESGVPDFTFDINGHPCLDPRTGKYAHTENSAIIGANYVIHELGMAEPISMVNWPKVAADADICDRLTETLGGSEALYRCSAYWTTDQRHEDVLDNIGYTMAGGIVPVNGQYETWVGAFTQPADGHDYDETVYADDGLDYKYSNPIDSQCNGVRGTFTSPFDNWETRDFPAYQNAAAVAEDGEEIFSDVAYPFVTSPSQAQRLAKIAFNFARFGTPATLNAKLDCLDSTSGDVIYLTDQLNGLSRQTFRIYSEEFNTSDMTFTFGLIKENASFYDYIASKDEKPYTGFASDPTYGDGLDIPSFLIAPAANNAARISVPESQSASVDYYEVSYQKTGAVDWIVLGNLPNDAEAGLTTGDLGSTGQQWNFRVRAVRDGTASEYGTQTYSAGTTVSAQSPPGGTVYVSSSSPPHDYTITAVWPSDLKVGQFGNTAQIDLIKGTFVKSVLGEWRATSKTVVATSKNGSSASFKQPFSTPRATTRWAMIITSGSGATARTTVTEPLVVNESDID